MTAAAFQQQAESFLLYFCLWYSGSTPRFSCVSPFFLGSYSLLLFGAKTAIDYSSKALKNLTVYQLWNEGPNSPPISFLPSLRS